MGGLVFIAAGESGSSGRYYPSSLITVKKGVKVLCADSWKCYFNIPAIANLIYMHKGAVWDGGYFRVAADTDFSGTVFMCDGDQGSSTYVPNFVLRNMIIRTSSNTYEAASKAIHLKIESSEGSTAGFYNSIFHNIKIYGYFGYGIYISMTDAAHYLETFTWNSFTDIILWGVINAIYIHKPGAWGSFGQNVFTNVSIQAKIDAIPYSNYGVYSNGNSCYFHNLAVSDWTSDCGKIISFGRLSWDNVVTLTANGSWAIDYMEDLGNNNSIRMLPDNPASSTITITANNMITPTTDGAAEVTTEMATNVFPLVAKEFTALGVGNERVCFYTPTKSTVDLAYQVVLYTTNPVDVGASAWGFWEVYAVRVPNLGALTTAMPLVSVIPDKYDEAWGQRVSDFYTKYRGKTADAGTDATKIIDAGMSGYQVPVGSYVYNTTRNLGAFTTAWDDATDTITVAIAGQSEGDVYNVYTYNFFPITGTGDAILWEIRRSASCTYSGTLHLLGAKITSSEAV
jgi:hypothetical protein